jgi:hypothetical protein
MIKMGGKSNSKDRGIKQRKRYREEKEESKHKKVELEGFLRVEIIAKI